MARWQKLLARMLSDATPTTYTYDDAASVLRGLGFELAPLAGGSHRKWRCQDATGRAVIVGLVEKGRGPLKPYLVRDMLKQLRGHGLVPRGLEPTNDLDD